MEHLSVQQSLFHLCNLNIFVERWIFFCTKNRTVIFYRKFNQNNKLIKILPFHHCQRRNGTFCEKIFNESRMNVKFTFHKSKKTSRSIRVMNNKKLYLPKNLQLVLSTPTSVREKFCQFTNVAVDNLRASLCNTKILTEQRKCINCWNV